MNGDASTGSVPWISSVCTCVTDFLGCGVWQVESQFQESMDTLMESMYSESDVKTLLGTEHNLFC